MFTAMPLSRATVEEGSSADEGMLVRVCSTERGFLVWLAAQLTYFAIILLFGIKVAIETRNVPTGALALANNSCVLTVNAVRAAFNESTFIGFSLLILLLGAVTILPVDFLIQGAGPPGASALLRGIGQAFVAFALTIVLFASKIYYIASNKADRDMRSELDSVLPTRDDNVLDARDNAESPDAISPRRPAQDARAQRGEPAAAYRVPGALGGDQYIPPMLPGGTARVQLAPMQSPQQRAQTQQRLATSTTVGPSPAASSAAALSVRADLKEPSPRSIQLQVASSSSSARRAISQQPPTAVRTAPTARATDAPAPASDGLKERESWGGGSDGSGLSVFGHSVVPEEDERSRQSSSLDDVADSSVDG